MERSKALVGKPALPASLLDTPDELIGRRVRVYVNLNRRRPNGLPMLSVQAGDGARRGRVIAHLVGIELADVRFTVSQAGRHRVLKEHRKNVHAFACGTVVSVADEARAVSFSRRQVRWIRKGGRVITYSPYAPASTFFDEDSREEVHHAGRLLIVSKRVVGRDGSMRQRAREDELHSTPSGKRMASTSACV
jgi:hypothetical protein